MTDFTLATCVRPMQIINNRKFMARMTPYLQHVKDNSRPSLIQACKLMLNGLPSDQRVVAFWGFAPLERRNDLVATMASLGISYLYISQVNESRFEGLCWTTKTNPISEFFACFDMGIDHVTIDLTSEFAMYESALQRINSGTSHSGTNPRDWPSCFQHVYKVGMISKMTTKEYTPENFMAMHLEMTRLQNRVRTLFDHNLNQEQEIRRLQLQYVNSFNNLQEVIFTNLQQAMDDISRAQDSLQFMVRMRENNRAMFESLSHQQHANDTRSESLSHQQHANDTRSDASWIVHSPTYSPSSPISTHFPS
jgi:hypothetical protein